MDLGYRGIYGWKRKGHDFVACVHVVVVSSLAINEEHALWPKVHPQVLKPNLEQETQATFS